MSRRGGRAVVVQWARDLLLGLRLTFASGRSGLTRAAMTAVGVGLGVALLLVAGSLPTMIVEREARTSARVDLHVGTDEPAAGANTLLIADVSSDFRDVPLRGRLVQPEGPKAPLPPGVPAFPRPGEAYVSPALAELLASPDGALVGPRVNYRVAGTIDKQGLSGPNEYAFYAGTDKLAAGATGVHRIARFGELKKSSALPVELLILVLVSLVVLLVPVAIFIATALRFGAEARDRQLAVVRLMGADGRMARRIAAGDAMASALLGLAAGAVFFLAGRQLVELVTLAGISVYAADVRPTLLLLLLVLAAVPVAAVLVTLFSLRKVVIEPLGVVRRSAAVRRRLWWRLILPVAGLAMMYPLLDSFDQPTKAQLAAGAKPKTISEMQEYQIAGGITLLLVGMALLLPWLVEVVVRRLGGGTVAWQLAVRRLQLDNGTAVRAVSGIAVAVAGAIALQTLFASVERENVRATGNDLSRAQVELVLGQDQIPLADRAAAALRQTDGVRAAYHITRTAAAIGDGSDENAPYTLVYIADCATATGYLSIQTCADGDVFVSDAKPQNSWDVAPKAGDQLTFNSAEQDPTTWTVPANSRGFTPPPSDNRLPGVVATPGAVRALADLDWSAVVYARVDTSDDAVYERVRNAAVTVDPLLRAQVMVATRVDSSFATIRTGLLLGALATLLLIGASLLVNTLEQLRERRKLLAVLVAFGTRRSTVSWSIMWQTAIPVALGLVLAVATGVGLGILLLAMADQKIAMDWVNIAATSGAGAFVVLAVTMLSLPVLARMMRPEGLRTE